MSPSDRRKILIVEDGELNRDLLIQLLEDEYELILAEDGAEGIKLSAEESPDLILMDLSLPVVNGWEATRQIKAKQGMPIIAITAHAMPGDEEKARAAGCDDFLTKPLDEDLLLSVIDKFLRGTVD